MSETTNGISRRPLGRTGLEIGEIGFGRRGLRFAGTDPDGVSRTLQTCVQKGADLFEVADPDGVGGRLVGQLLKTAARRAYVLLRVGRIRREPETTVFDFSHDYLRRFVGEALEQLGVGRLDLVLLDEPPLAILQADETWDVLHELKDRGRAAHCGAAVTDTAAARIAIQRGDVEAVMLPHNLLERVPTDFFDEAEERGIGILVSGPLARGRLAGATARDPENRDAASFQFLWDAETGRTPAQAALRFCLAHPVVAAVLPGMRRSEQAAENLDASFVPELTEAELLRLERLP
jgi:aryl-alcohol dehydrogenase-like predicted oxidoreductase